MLGGMQPPAPAAPQQFQLAYSEPFWSGIAPGSSWRLEVVRSGVELEPVDLSSKACHLVGRVPVCDIVLENDTVSRQHAVFQSRPNGKLYLFDLGSTHGTFVNKKRLEPKVYVELVEGVHIKFGSSARTHILCGGPPPPVVAAVETPKTETAEPVKSKRKKKKEEDFFVGSAEDAEKFVKQKQHEKRRKERGLQMKKQKEKETRKRDEFDDDDADEVDEEKNKKASSAADNDSDDSDAPINAGEAADPDKLVVGAARSNWDDYEMNQEEDDYYDRAKRADAKVDPNGAGNKALTRDDIVNRKIDLDLRIRELESKIAASERNKAAGGGGGDDEEDALDAYMKVVASDKEAELVKKMRIEKEDLEKERTKMERLLKVATGTLDRMKEETKRTDTLESRVAAVLDQGFVAPVEKKDESRATKPDTSVVVNAAAAAPRSSNVVDNARKSGTAAAIAEFVKRESKRAKTETAPARSRIVAQDPDYEDEEWIAPANQTGDGTTELNKKLGY